MKYGTLPMLIVGLLATISFGQRSRPPVPLSERIGEFDAVVYGIVTDTSVERITQPDGTLSFQAVVEVSVAEVLWSRDDQSLREKSNMSIALPGTGPKEWAETRVQGSKGQRGIWFVDGHGTRANGYVERARDVFDPSRPAEAALDPYRKASKALAPYRQVLLRLDVAPGNAIAEVPIQLSLRWEDVDQAGFLRDPGAPNVGIEARVIVGADAGGLTPDRKYRVHVTSIRPTTVTDGKARRGIIRMSARMIGVERALEEKEPSVEPVQRCEIRAVVQLPDGSGRLASPWVQVAVIRPVLHDGDKKLIEEVSGRQLWGLIGPHKETLSEKSRADLEGMLVRHSESFLAPAIRCGLAFRTTGRPVERAAELRALSADAGFGWRDECLLKAYALLRDAKKNAEAGEVAAELAARCRIEGAVIEAAGSGRDHAPDSTSDILPNQQEGQ